MSRCSRWVSAGIDGSDALLLFAAPVTLFGLLGWATFWQPCVRVSDGGVTIANTLRTVEVPWPAIEAVDGRYGLRLRTAFGTFSSWAAPAPSGRRRAVVPSSSASRSVEDRLDSLRSAGHLDDTRFERPTPRSHWHVPVLVGIAVLVVASVMLPWLA